MFRIITILILACFIAVPASLAGESKTRIMKRAPAKAQTKHLSAREQSALINREMRKLGFQVRSVQPRGGSSWDVQISGFDPGRAAGAYQGAIGMPGSVMSGDGEDAPTGNPEDPDGGDDGGDGGGEDAPTGDPDDPDGARWNSARLNSMRSVSRNATLRVNVTEAGLIDLNQNSLGRAGFESSIGDGLCDMFSCMGSMLDTRSLPATNSARTR